jgi:indole-3-glycerol phosphate synthase
LNPEAGPDGGGEAGLSGGPDARRQPGLLTRLLDEARAEVDLRRGRMPQAHLERLGRALPAPRDFRGALRRERLAVIAEMKARTPVMGLLSHEYVPGRLAAVYTAAGAAALSVLCQETSFGGRPEHLAEARAVSGLPILRKDFVVDEYQVVEARAYGADAVLLIVAATPEAVFRELLDAVRRTGMQPLVEVKDEDELETALRAGAEVVGVNHRDLRTFQVDRGLTARLRPLLPPEVVCVAESGVHTAEDARQLRRAGADAVLVGEALMRSGDPGAKLRELQV